MENPRAPQKDDALVVTHYRRTAQQDAMLGLEVLCLGGEGVLKSEVRGGLAGVSSSLIPALRGLYSGASLP